MRTGLLVFILAITLHTPCSFASDTGEMLYRKNDFKSAYRHYSNMLQNGSEYADVYYNLGNCAFRMDSLGPAIAYYYKALKVDPGHEDAQFNLALASSKTRDRIAEIPESNPKKMLRKIVFLGSRNQWAWLSIVFCVMTFSILLLRRQPVFNNGYIWLMLVLINLFLGIFSFGLAMGRQSLEGPGARLVVREASVNVKSGPAESGSDLFILHEGTVGELLEDKDNWLLIRLSNGNKGWLKTDSVIRI